MYVNRHVALISFVSAACYKFYRTEYRLIMLVIVVYEFSHFAVMNKKQRILMLEENKMEMLRKIYNKIKILLTLIH